MTHRLRSPVRSTIDVSGLRSAWHRCGDHAQAGIRAGHRVAADRAFLGGYCTGYERFERYLLGLDDGIKTRMGLLSGSPPASARSGPRRMAEHRTLITTSLSFLQRIEHGEQTGRD